MPTREMPVYSVPGERRLKVKGGFVVFGPSEDYEYGASYVRLVNTKGEEVLYYDNQEWAEDPECVMGIIARACIEGIRGFEKRMNEIYKDKQVS